MEEVSIIRALPSAVGNRNDKTIDFKSEMLLLSTILEVAYTSKFTYYSCFHIKR